MPIIFRCPHCSQKLSVSRRKAGQEVTCPECVKRLRVPQLENDDTVRVGAEAVHFEVVPDDLPQEQPEKNPWLNDDEDEGQDFKFEKRGFDEDALDMTPMVDVTFLLLIFFMITASFAVQKSLQTTPPEPEEEGVSQNVSQEDVEEESVVVDIDAENNIRVDDVPVGSIPELIDVLAAKRANERKGDMLIEVHELAQHGTVVAVTDAGLDADMQRIRRVTHKGDD